MRIALIISSLRAGGAERVASILVNYWASKGWEVYLVTLSGRDDPPFYGVDPAVQHVALGVTWLSRNPAETVINSWRRTRAIRRSLERIRPDVVISFMDTTNVLAILATWGLRVPVVVSNRVNPDRQHVGRAERIFRDSLYARASAVVVQTERAWACFPAPVQSRCVVIPNPVVAPPPPLLHETPALSGRSVVAVGRLTEQKGFDLLISAFGTLAARYPDWRLVIVGEGPLRTSLERQVTGLGLSERVSLPGRMKDIDQVLRRSDLFVLSSRYEGFPNALCEAMASGLAVVSTDCPFGPAEIIRDGVDGVLVPNGDAGALARALDRLIGDEDERRRLALRAPDIVDRFGKERVMKMWNEVIKRAAA